MSYSVRIASEPVVTERFKQALETDYVVIGGDNAKKRGKLSPGARLANSANVFVGEFRLDRAFEEDRPCLVRGDHSAGRLAGGGHRAHR